MVAKRSTRRAKSPVANASSGASAPAPIDLSSSSIKHEFPSKSSDIPCAENGASVVAPIEVSASSPQGAASKAAHDSSTINVASAAGPNDDHKNTTENSTITSEHLAAAPIDVPSKTVKDSAAANGTLENQEDTSPKGKKRALPGPADDQEPTQKKTKELPQTHPELCPMQESSLAAESSTTPSDEAAVTFDKEKWQGYCEIENEPAFFSVILREIGVQNVTVRQVLMLDPDILATMPNPIFGLILCYRHRDFDVDSQEKTCPPNIWFANQMPAQNSCATLAMIHTLLNTDNKNIDVGERMRQFRDYSKDLTPFHRGQAFASWQFVKNIHNSFAKKMDIYQDDENLARKVRKAEKAKLNAGLSLKPTPKPKAPTAKSRRDSQDSTATDASKESFEENAQHYIAFIPSNGTVWKLDGMNIFPTRMGSYDEAGGESWTDAASDRIQALMTAGGDAEYSVFAIAQSPLIELHKDIVETDNTIKAVGHRLDSLSADWHAFVPGEDIEPPSPSWLGSFTDEQRATFPVPDEVQENIEEEELAELLARRAELVSEIRRLAVAWQQEETAEEEEVEAAEKRRFDFQPFIKRWLEMLAENGQLEELAAEFPAW
jgi:ubiquitin carboxyl-terminal hydrolase L5